MNKGLNKIHDKQKLIKSK